MNNQMKLVAVGVLWASLVAMDARAATNVVSPTATAPIGRVILPSSDQLSTVDSVDPLAVNRRLQLTERNALSQEVLDRIARFKKDAQKYLEQQEALRRQLLGATDAERARIRAKIQELRQQWLERARELRQEFKDRQIELRDKLPGHREVLEGAREAAREQLKDKVRDTKSRGGQD